MNNSLLKRFQITITGPNVQRCGFRKEAVRLAKEMGLTGYAAYVEKDFHIEVEGNEQLLFQYIEWCKKGPRFCEIDGVENIEIEYIGDIHFINIPGVVTSKVELKSA